jgi:hypothetical protein
MNVNLDGDYLFMCLLDSYVILYFYVFYLPMCLLYPYVILYFYVFYLSVFYRFHLYYKLPFFL